MVYLAFTPVTTVVSASTAARQPPNEPSPCQWKSLLTSRGVYKIVRASYEAHWRRSSIGHDCRLTHKLDSGNWRLLIASPVLQMNVLLSVSTVGAIFKAVALREKYVKTIWTVYLTESHYGLFMSF